MTQHLDRDAEYPSPCSEILGQSWAGLSRAPPAGRLASARVRVQARAGTSRAPGPVSEMDKRAGVTVHGGATRQHPAAQPAILNGDGFLRREAAGRGRLRGEVLRWRGGRARPTGSPCLL